MWCGMDAKFGFKSIHVWCLCLPLLLGGYGSGRGLCCGAGCFVGFLMPSLVSLIFVDQKIAQSEQSLHWLFGGIATDAKFLHADNKDSGPARDAQTDLSLY